MWLSWSNIAVVIHFTYKLTYQCKLGTVSSFCNRFWEQMSLVIHRNKNHSFQVTSPWPSVTSYFGNLIWIISEPTTKCNLLNIPIDMETIAWRAADTYDLLWRNFDFCVNEDGWVLNAEAQEAQYPNLKLPLST